MFLHGVAEKLWQYILRERDSHRLNVCQDNGLYRYTSVELSKVLGRKNYEYGWVVGNAMTLLHELGKIRIVRRKRSIKSYGDRKTVYVIEIPS